MKRLALPSLLAAVCIAGSLSFPSTSFAHDPMYPKLNFHFRLGVAGDFEGRAGSGPTQRGPMEPGFGGGVELEVPLNPTFSLGAAFEAYGWTVGNAPDRYNVSLDFLFMPRFRIPFGAHPWHAEVYFGLPIGPTVSLPHERFQLDAFDTGFGVTGGGRVGFRINVNDIVGFFIDAGPMIQYVSYPSRTIGSNFDVWHYQLVLRAGGSFGLGG
ncbi:MAG: hypothetical protein M3Y87_17000 [Myxococcota bacterium]|nr:hypothetical protein [Myxococcota bacterium]